MVKLRQNIFNNCDRWSRNSRYKYNRHSRAICYPVSHIIGGKPFLLIQIISETTYIFSTLWKSGEDIFANRRKKSLIAFLARPTAPNVSNFELSQVLSEESANLKLLLLQSCRPIIPSSSLKGPRYHLPLAVKSSFHSDFLLQRQNFQRVSSRFL